MQGDRSNRLQYITARGWFYTIYYLPNKSDGNPRTTTLDFQDWFDGFEACGGAVQYACGQVERCPRTGRLHLQLWVEFSQPVRFSRLARLRGLEPGYGYAEPRRGTPEEATAYCSKEDTRVCGPFEYGRIPLGTSSPQTHTLPNYWATLSAAFVLSTLCQDSEI